MIEIRALTDARQDLTEAVRLQKEIWGFEEVELASGAPIRRGDEGGWTGVRRLRRQREWSAFCSRFRA